MKRIFFILLSFLLISCKEKSVDELFNTFVNCKTDEKYITFQTSDIVPYENLDKNYKKIIENQSTGTISFLYEKAKSTKETKYFIPDLVCPMTEGDIAICMLIDMFNMPDKYFDEVMYENIERKTNSARDFWDYIHSSDNNREEIIQEIKDYYSLITRNAYFAPEPWNEDEIINHSFELISNTKIETFLFKKTEEGLLLTSCTYGKKGESITCPIESWHIDKDGFLCISPYNTVLSKKIIRIGKLGIDEENEILHAQRNSKEVKYKYKKN